MMGHASEDGEFKAFQKKVQALSMDRRGLSVCCETVHGETLSFGWEGSLLVNEQEQSIADFRHYENPYCTVAMPARQIEIRTNHYLLELDFSLE
jgi:hypothetical protein